MLRGDRRGAENHHRTQQAQRQRYAKQAAVSFETSRHLGSPFSGGRTGGLLFKLADQFFENAPAVFVISELVETCASRGKQHDVARLRGVRGRLDGALKSLSALNGYAACNLLLDFFRGRADEQREDRFLAQRLLQRGVVAAFVLAAENIENPAGKCVERF